MDFLIFTLLNLLLSFPLKQASSGVNETLDHVETKDKLQSVLNELKVSNLNPSDWSADVETYQPPEILKFFLPYYVLGYDFEKRPVFVWETGRWDLRSSLELGPEMAKDVVRYSEQMWYRIGTARQNDTLSAEDDDIGAALIVDAVDFSIRQLLSVDAMAKNLLQARWGEKVQGNLAYIICINVNFVGQTWLNIIRPIAGKFFGRLEVYGPNREIWQAVLRTKIPRDQLPTWYGGTDNYKPLQLY